ncbi:phosphatidylinositol-glycan biosynthesis class S protein [Apiospora hydei]|uniref:Phosphatidylinositol-glycan biosynthesis class S protein n=1 Tax=Apiospora hydei TaxID=1337664 RepID=A0ABR1VWJ5_9PEZI
MSADIINDGDSKPASAEATVSLPATGIATVERKEPPPEKDADTRRRTWIVISFWLIAVFIGLPIWWNTTTIYRANLPLTQMTDWADGKACEPVFPLRIALDVGSLPEQEAQNLLRLTQHALDDLNDFSGHHLRLQLAQAPAETITPVRDDSNVALTIRLAPGDAAHTASSSLHPHLPILDVQYPPNSLPTANSPSSGLATYIATQLGSTFAEEQNIISYLLETSSITSEHKPKGISQEVVDTVSKRMTRSLKYSQTYHLTFSLFTNGPVPSSWDIEAAIDEYLKPVLDMLKPIHDFTIDTQVQLYAAPGVQSQVLGKEDLSSFINAAEWPLSPSIGGAPTVNFIVYIGNQTIGVPSETSPGETSQSWMIPQWGSVYLLAPPAEATHVSSETLKQPILTFTSHLLTLLARIRSADLLLRASSSLGSLARLTLALPSISIPSNVADGVVKTIHHLELACASLGGAKSLEHARIAEAEAERAFFEKSMVGQLYFPDEHKVAVYLPLLGPIGVPLVMGLLNEIKTWKNKRSQKLKAA